MSNSLAKVHPELISQWSDKNLPLTPDDVTYGSNKVVCEVYKLAFAVFTAKHISNG